MSRVCQGCAGPIPPVRHPRAQYCGGGRCARQTKVLDRGQCVTCGGPMLLEPMGTGRPRLTCSAECRAARKRGRDVVHERIDGFQLAEETIAAGGDWRLAVEQWFYHEGSDVERIASIVGKTVGEVQEVIEWAK